MLKDGVVGAIMAPRLASTTPFLSKALFQTMMVMTSFAVLTKVFVYLRSPTESTNIMLDPCGLPMFPALPMISPKALVPTPKEVTLLAMPTMLLHWVVLPELDLGLSATALDDAALGATLVLEGA